MVVFEIFECVVLLLEVLIGCVFVLDIIFLFG